MHPQLPLRPPSQHGWVLVAGLALAAIGLARPPQGGPSTGPQVEDLTPSLPALANADSNNRMIAVTGIDITGSSILYLVDTVDYRLAVYQATGGSESMQGVKLVGARRIDLDLQLDGLNDKSQYSYKRLREEFQKKGLLPSDGTARD